MKIAAMIYPLTQSGQTSPTWININQRYLAQYLLFKSIIYLRILMMISYHLKKLIVG